MESISNLVASLSALVNQALIEFLNEPGVLADLNGLLYVAKAYAKIYEELLNWSIETNSTLVPDDCKGIRDKIAVFADKILISLREFPEIMMTSLMNAKNNIGLGEKIEINLSLKIELDEQALQDYSVEFEKLRIRLLS